jgi:hypothetical protein
MEHVGRKKQIQFLEHKTADDCSMPGSGYMGRLIIVFVHGTRREKKVQETNTFLDHNPAYDCYVPIFGSMGRLNTVSVHGTRGEEEKNTFLGT